LILDLRDCAFGDPHPATIAALVEAAPRLEASA
jgi:hypothetical protein